MLSSFLSDGWWCKGHLVKHFCPMVLKYTVMAFCAPWRLSRSAPGVSSSSGNVSPLLRRGGVPWGSHYPVLGTDPGAASSPPSSFPSHRKGLWVFQLWNRKEIGILFTYPLSCSHLFKTSPCNVLLIAVAPRLPDPSCSLVHGGPEVPGLGCSEGFKSQQADSRD